MIDLIFWFSLVVFLLTSLMIYSVIYTNNKKYGKLIYPPQIFVTIFWVLSLAGLISTSIVG